MVESTTELPQAGDKAPPFTLPRDGGGTVALKDFAGKKLVLYFYPRADTPGCTKEAIAFSKLKAAFGRADTEVLGVSADPVPAQDKFKTKHKLTIALASVAGEIDVWAEIPWCRARHFSDRPRPAHRPCLAQGFSGRSRGGRLGHRQKPVSHRTRGRRLLPFCPLGGLLWAASDALRRNSLPKCLLKSAKCLPEFPEY
jgi:thioredoxin-dependent peroxiredoxin